METVNPNIEYDELIKVNFIYRLESELKVAFDDERKEILQKILRKVKGDKEPEKIKTNKNKENFDAFFEKLSNDVYKKPWHKIPDMNKIEKIKEYVNNLELDKKGKKLMETNLISQLKEGKLGKVDYDNKDYKIIKIKV